MRALNSLFLASIALSGCALKTGNLDDLADPSVDIPELASYHVEKGPGRSHSHVYLFVHGNPNEEMSAEEAGCKVAIFRDIEERAEQGIISGVFFESTSMEMDLREAYYLPSRIADRLSQRLRGWDDNRLQLYMSNITNQGTLIPHTPENQLLLTPYGRAPGLDIIVPAYQDTDMLLTGWENPSSVSNKTYQRQEDHKQVREETKRLDQEYDILIEETDRLRNELTETIERLKQGKYVNRRTLEERENRLGELTETIEKNVKEYVALTKLYLEGTDEILDRAVPRTIDALTNPQLVFDGYRVDYPDATGYAVLIGSAHWDNIEEYGFANMAEQVRHSIDAPNTTFYSCDTSMFAE